MKAVKVTLREKKISDGRKSLYLDFYPAIPNADTGKETRREFLGLYILERPRTEVEKQTNKETKILAENIRAQRQLSIQSGNFGFFEQKKQNVDFLAFFRDCIEDRKGSNQSNWLSAYKYLEEFTEGQCKMTDITEDFLEEFKEFLLDQDLAINSCVSYYNKIAAAVKEAFHKKHLTQNPALRVKGIKPEDTQREFLTLEEVQLLVDTDCDPPSLKQAAVFAILTGLRWSDIQNLTWGQIQYTESSGYFIRFTQQKTKGKETLPIPDDAVKLLGEAKANDAMILPDMKYSAWNNLKLKQWIMQAGISKEITFHCFRHTFATLQLTLGTDIYTLKDLLGHKAIKNTQIYGKIVDQKKVDAANRIKLKM